MPIFLNIQIIPSSSEAESLYFSGRLYSTIKKYVVEMEYYRHYNGLYLFNGFYLRVHGTQYLVINDIRSHGHVTDIIYTAEVFSSKTLDHSSCRGQRYSQYRNSHNMSFLLILTSVCAIIWFFSCVSSTVCLCIIKEASTQVLLTRYSWLSQRLRWREFFSAFVLFPDEIFGSPLRSISPHCVLMTLLYVRRI